MSGIYGYINNIRLNNTDMPNLDRLSIWNKAYGKAAHHEKVTNDYLLGCHYEKLHTDAICPGDMICQGGKVWTIDAVLYNRDQIYEQIDVANNKVETLSDEELMVELIEQNGFEALAAVNGDFAGAVYDETSGSLTMFRDHMGIRPLYYYVSDECICFSTDLRGVLAVDNVDVSINDEWVYRYFFTLIEYTMTSTEYKHIYCVRPASYIKIEFKKEVYKNKYPSRLLHAKEYDYEVDDSQRDYWRSLSKVAISEKKYWHLGSKKIRYKTEAEYSSKMRELIEDSIRRRLNVFDGIAGAEFSGGLDSSLISILIKLMGRECVYCSWSNDPKDFPLAEEDERRTILEICERYSIDCEFLTKKVNFNKFTQFVNNCSEVLDINNTEDELDRYAFWPMLDTLQLLNSASFVANSGGKVVFTGHGGDEGVSHRPNPYELLYHGELGNYLEYYINLRECRNFKYIRGLRRAVVAFYESHNALKTKKHSIEKTRMYNDYYWNIISDKLLEEGSFIKNIPLSFAYDVVKFILRNGSRKRMDCVAVYGAYCDVRYMFPYLDYRVIDYAASIERGMYLRHGTDRYVLKNAFRDVLPDRLLGDINKYDPSFANIKGETYTLERKVEVIRNRLVEYRDYYNCKEAAGMFNIDNILSEMDSKKITEQNIGELISKCEVVIDTLRLQMLVKKARNEPFL